MAERALKQGDKVKACIPAHFEGLTPNPSGLFLVNQVDRSFPRMIKNAFWDLLDGKPFRCETDVPSYSIELLDLDSNTLFWTRDFYVHLVEPD